MLEMIPYNRRELLRSYKKLLEYMIDAQNSKLHCEIFWDIAKQMKSGKYQATAIRNALRKRKSQLSVFVEASDDEESSSDNDDESATMNLKAIQRQQMKKLLMGVIRTRQPNLIQETNPAPMVHQTSLEEALVIFLLSLTGHLLRMRIKYDVIVWNNPSFDETSHKI